MVSNYLKNSLRNLKKRKSSTFINIVGLTIGFTSFLLLIAYTNYEENFDNFHTHKKTTYRIILERHNNNKLKNKSVAVMAPLFKYLKSEIPEIKKATRYYQHDKKNVIRSKTSTNKEENVCYADTDFFSIFSFELP